MTPAREEPSLPADAELEWSDVVANNAMNRLRGLDGGARSVGFGHRYQGADDRGGPNHSGQPSVRSHHRSR